MLTKVEDYLKSVGCCMRCITVYLGDSKVEGSNEDSVKESNGSVSNSVCEEKFEDLESKETTCNDAESDPLLDVNLCHTKKLKSSVCISCLGLLQLCDSKEVISKFADAIENGDFEAEMFSVSISHPVCLAFRIHSIWAHLLKKFPNFHHDPARKNHMGVLKDMWRNFVGPKLCETIKKTFVCGQLVPFNVAIQADYNEDYNDCLLLEKLDEKKYYIRRKHHKKFSEGVFTKQAVEETLRNLPDEEFLKACPDIPPLPKESVNYARIECTHTSIYFAGRYNKYSRELPQTPWFVEDDRRFTSSVQELICNPLNFSVKADGVKFSASGREDVDVRCLGRGRPFVVEFLNPRRINFDADALRSIQQEVNRSTELINVKDLQMVTKKAMSNLKEGEEEKTKSYCALCFSRERVTEEMLQKVQVSELTLNQLTPLRVAHRRPLAVRKRIVHTMTAERVDQHFFKLYLKTQAGTYIKEFVHGDFGRTTPNLGTLFGVKCDIIALDVENVQLDWPPSL